MKETIVNRYGALAMDHWRQLMPRRLKELPNPEQHFSRLGEDIAQAIDTLARQLAGTAPAKETYLQRLRRLTMARQDAENQVLQQMLPTPPTPS